MWRGPCALCFAVAIARQLVLVRIQWIHPVGWCVVLQGHYGGGFRMAVAFFGAVQYVSLVSLSARGHTQRQLHEVEKVVSRGGWASVCLRCLAEWSHPCRCFNLTGQCCLMETRCVDCVDVPIRPS
jgi:hypothetical protein